MTMCGSVALASHSLREERQPRSSMAVTQGQGDETTHRTGVRKYLAHNEMCHQE